ncbi:MAG: leucine-rich repeat domain-containing protein, partial [Thermoflexibacteraceae bacterium]
LYGFMDKKGTVLIDFKYSVAFPFDDDTSFSIVKKKIYSDNNKDTLLLSYLSDPNKRKQILDKQALRYDKNNITEKLYLIDTLKKEYRMEYAASADTNVIAVDLRDMQMDTESIDSSLWAMQQLSILLLNKNKLKSVPPAIKKLSKLKTLHLSRNHLEALPDELTALTQLEVLNMSNNQLTVLPPEIVNLPNLTLLDISANNIEQLPQNISNLQKLRFLDMSGNRHIKNLPDDLANIPNMCLLNLQGTNIDLELVCKIFSKYPKKIFLTTDKYSKPYDPHVLLIKVNNLKTNTITKSISLLENLHFLDFCYNNLDSLPTQMPKLLRLDSLNLAYNHIDSLPITFGQLASLKYLDLSNNNISILRDADIDHLKSLRVLYLGNNILEKLPDNIGSLDSLEQLYLGDNKLTKLPASIGHLKNLKVLDIRNNHLREIPKEIGKLASLTHLILLRNQLTSLPKEIGKLKNLKVLVLYENLFIEKEQKNIENYFLQLPTTVSTNPTIKYEKISQEAANLNSKPDEKTEKTKNSELAKQLAKSVCDEMKAKEAQHPNSLSYVNFGNVAWYLLNAGYFEGAKWAGMQYLKKYGENAKINLISNLALAYLYNG